MAAKKTRTKKTQSKSHFIRQYPSLSTAEIIAAGKKAGMTISSSLVYMVRGRAAKSKKAVAKKTMAATGAAPRSTSTPTARPMRATPRTAPPVPRPIATASSAENLLKALGAEIGLGRAIEILAGERARVAAVLRG